MAFVGGLLLLSSGETNSQTYSDRVVAFQVCEIGQYSFSSSAGAGDYVESDARLSCFAKGFLETNSTWIAFTASSDGEVLFDITPSSLDDDLDFVVYRADGVELEPIRCMASGFTDWYSSRSKNLPCSGKTGLSATSTDVGESSGCGSGDDNYLKSLSVKAGSTYNIVVNNYSSSDGFVLDFSSTASLNQQVCLLNSNTQDLGDLAVVYPVPCRTHLIIDGFDQSLEGARYRVYSTTGVPVQEGKISDGQISVTALLSSIYILQVDLDSETFTHRFIKL